MITINNSIIHLRNTHISYILEYSFFQESNYFIGTFSFGIFGVNPFPAIFLPATTSDDYFKIGFRQIESSGHSIIFYLLPLL